MKITDIAVKNYQFTLVMFLLLVALGIYSFLSIPQSEDPEFDVPVIPIYAIYPGASPVDLEKLVVDKIEKSLNIDEIAKLLVEVYRYSYDHYLIIPICELSELTATAKRIPKWNLGARRNDRNYYDLIRQQ